MKKALIAVVALVVVLGAGVMSASAQTPPAWVWGNPISVGPGLTDLTADPVSDALYGVGASGPVPVPIDGAQVTEGLVPLSGVASAASDMTVYNGVVYTVTEGAIATFEFPSTFTLLDGQPMVPPFAVAATPGTLKAISAGKGGTLFVLYQDGEQQYLLIGTPPAQTVTATALFSPRTLNLTSRGNWVTCNITLGEGYSGASVNLDNVCITAINDVALVPSICRAPGSPVVTGDQMMIKFSRAQLAAAVTGLTSATLTLQGAGERPVEGSTPEAFEFSATDTITILSGGRGRR